MQSVTTEQTRRLRRVHIKAVSRSTRETPGDGSGPVRRNDARHMGDGTRSASYLDGIARRLPWRSTFFNRKVNESSSAILNTFRWSPCPILRLACRPILVVYLLYRLRQTLPSLVDPQPGRTDGIRASSPAPPALLPRSLPGAPGGQRNVVGRVSIDQTRATLHRHAEVARRRAPFNRIRVWMVV